jgi:3-hydroxymyristoyl/3-hydroxydecanoyl-(acyl carrier protein) dehydratase
LFVHGDGQGDTSGFLIEARFDNSNPYIADGSDDPVVPRPIVLEALAQALAVLAHRSFDATQSGVLAMLKDAQFSDDVRCSDRVELHVKQQRHFAKLWWYAVRATRRDEQVASAQIVVAHLGAAA